MTSDQNLSNESDLIIFHLPNKFEKIPKFKFSFQKWMLMIYESPLNSNGFSELNGLFDLTSTYKATSNLSSFYYTRSPHLWTKGSTFNKSKNYLNGKNKFIAALVSNCNDKSLRQQYLNDLKRFIPVSIYGKCGEPCEHADYNLCKKHISRTHKFYFAFENAVCRDYVTEKFFDILKFDVVPVVFGGADYERYVPKTGFINALDFESPQALASHLLAVASNKTWYNSFFEWKQYVQFNPDNVNNGIFCELCIKLNLGVFRQAQSQPISDLDAFWSPESDCRIPVKKLNGNYAYVNI
jgi:alpha-1,3-fucosyltransferase